MLLPADAALCERDRALPGLATVLDAGRFAALAGLSALTPGYLRYKPGTSCVVGLMSDAEDCRAFAAMTYPPDRYAEVRARRSWWEGPDAVLFFDEICTALVPMTRDRRLKAARMLRNADDRARLLGDLGLDGAALTLLRYKPGRRLVLRAETASGLTAVIKAHAPGSFAAAAAGASHAARAAGAPLVGIHEAYGCVLTRWSHGEVLDPATGSAGLFRMTGAELARLHRAEPPAGLARAEWHPHGGARALAALLPHLAAQGEAASAAVASQLAQLKPATCPIHGDFSADQVVIAGGRPVVIDWDRLAEGHPSRDLGTFLARLDADAMEGKLPAAAAETAGEALLEGYAAAAGRLPEGIAACRAAALIALLPEGFRRRHPEWPALAEAMLARVRDLTAHPPPKRRRPTPGLAEALDPRLMAPKLAEALQAAPTEPPAIQLLRHKPGRRALLRYDLPGQPPLLGKLRAKGPDRRTPALHRRLRAAGLDGRAPARIGVPDARGDMTSPAIWLQSLVPGEMLTGLLRPGAATDPARRAGHALAALHDAGVEPDRSWSMEDEFAVLDRALTTAATEDDRLAAQILPLHRAARTLMAGLPPTTPTGIHRDFYPDQLLIDGGAVWLLDLDLYTQGDPMIDLGNFLAHLDELGLRLHGDPAALAPHAEAFVAGYHERRAVDHPRMTVLRLISLARHIQLSRVIEGRAHTTADLIRHCAATAPAALDLGAALAGDDAAR